MNTHDRIHFRLPNGHNACDDVAAADLWTRCRTCVNCEHCRPSIPPVLQEAAERARFDTLLHAAGDVAPRLARRMLATIKEAVIATGAAT